MPDDRVRVTPSGSVIVEIPCDVVREAIGMSDLVPRPSVTELRPLAEVEERYVAHVLACCDGNKARAARVLEIDRRSLYRLIARIEAARAKAA